MPARRLLLRRSVPRTPTTLRRNPLAAAIPRARAPAGGQPAAVPGGACSRSAGGISIGGGKYAVDGGAFTADPVSVSPGASVAKLPRSDMPRNIVLSHHERIDGSGYPQGLTGQHTPLEARIVTVADVFDALTSRRPYKPAWSNERALHELSRLSGVTLDRMCVEALATHVEAIMELQAQFGETEFG